MTRRRTPLALLLLLLLVGVGSVLIGVLGALGDGSGDEARAAEGDDSAEGESDSERETRRSRKRTHVAPVERGELGEGGEGVAEGETGRNGGERGPDDAERDSELGADDEALPAPPEERERVTVKGRVVGAATGKGLSGVRILVVRAGRGWDGTRTDETGAFVGTVPDPSDPAVETPVELRIAMKGYRTQIVPWTSGEPVITLEARAMPPLPGIVEGLATDPSGRVVSGRLLIASYDEMGDHFGQWVRADESGAFRLEGLAPGHWQMRLAGGSAAVDVIVPEGGRTSMHLRAGATAWPGTLTRERFEELHRELSLPGPTRTDSQSPDVEQDGESAMLDERRRAARMQARQQAIQNLESRWRGVAPERDVIVSGLPQRDFAYVRAATTNGPNESWRVAVRGGVARLRLTYERWRLILEIPGEEELSLTLIVNAGEGAQTVPWTR